MRINVFQNKKWYISILCVLFCCANLSGNEINDLQKSNADLRISNNSIFLNIEGTIISAKSISSAEDCLMISLADEVDPLFCWLCDCGAFNWCWRSTCWKCGLPE